MNFLPAEGVHSIETIISLSADRGKYSCHSPAVLTVCSFLGPSNITSS